MKILTIWRGDPADFFRLWSPRLTQSDLLPEARPSTPQDRPYSDGGGDITWPEYRAAHMDLPVQEALRRFRAIKRGQNPNTMTGGMHI